MDALLKALAVPVSAAYVPGVRPWFVSESGTCQLYRDVVGGVNVFTFGPTQDWQEWMVDFFALEVPVHQHSQFGPVHLGFWLDIQSSVAKMSAALADLGWPPYYIADHSKGAGEGILAHAQMKAAGHAPLATRAYEPPCVGGPALTAYLTGEDIGWTKTMNATGADLVTQVPDGPTWQHQGVETILRVPDSYGLAQKHEWPAVLAALDAA